MINDEPVIYWAGWLAVSASSAKLLFTWDWCGDARKFNRKVDDSDKEAAEKACQRIDLFIQSGGMK